MKPPKTEASLKSFLRNQKMLEAEKYHETREKVLTLIAELREISALAANREGENLGICSVSLHFSEQIMGLNCTSCAIAHVQDFVCKYLPEQSYPLYGACYHIGRFALMDEHRSSWIGGADLAAEARDWYHKALREYRQEIKRLPYTFIGVWFKIRAWWIV